MFSSLLENSIYYFKKITAVSLVFLSAVIFLFPKLVNAQESNVPTVARLGTNTLESTIVNIINIFLGLLGLIALILILYAGYIWMTSAGNEEKVSQAKKILTSAVIGLVIIMSAYAITKYLFNTLQDKVDNGGNNNDGREYGFGSDFGSGALGGGVIEYHYPERNANNVPRNTMIMMTFKVEVATSSIIAESFLEGSLGYNICQNYLNNGSECGKLSEGIIINNNVNSENNAILGLDEVVAILSADAKNVVLKPIVYLGNENNNSQVSVFLSSTIKTSKDEKLFSSMNDGYSWSFEVSTFLDLTPPTVSFVWPEEDEIVARNAILQINFSEPINILSFNGNVNVGTRSLGVAGKALEGSDFIPYNDNRFELRISNRYRTLEFLSKLPCGGYTENSCGEEVFCLPPDSVINTTLNAGNLVDLSSGINDSAGNFLDGNSNGEAEGGETDNYSWIFSTNDSLKLDAPVITSINPKNNSASNNLNTNISATFNSVLSASSLNSDNLFIYKHNADLGCDDLSDNSEEPYIGSSDNIPFSVGNDEETFYCFPNYIVYLNSEGDLKNNKCNIKIRSPFLNMNSVYRSRITSNLKDSYGNCFNSAFGPAPISTDSNRKDRGQQ